LLQKIAATAFFLGELRTVGTASKHTISLKMVFREHHFCDRFRRRFVPTTFQHSSE